MPPLPRTYRGAFRNALLSVAFLVGAAFFAGVTVFTANVAGRIGAGVLAAIMLYVAVRTVLMRAVVSADGIRLHGPLHTLTVPWSEVTEVTSGDTETDGNLLPVRTPVLKRAQARRIKLTMVSSYAFGPSRETNADRAAKEIEDIRRTFAP